MNSLYNAVVDKDLARESGLVTEIKNTECKKAGEAKAVYQELIARYLEGI
ncbi:hypothetical protein KY326_04515 [Candidatus Woesearchaeota archaeon]|nr:hypothetical protein [Candidatus Woesearchaeota archaeon]